MNSSMNSEICPLEMCAAKKKKKKKKKTQTQNATNARSKQILRLVPVTLKH